MSKYWGLGSDVLPLLTVLDLADPSKTEALNAGDDLCTAFPRIYLDADITLGAHALERLITDLTTKQPRVASPRVHFDVSASDAMVRAYYAVFTLLPYTTDSMIGLGVYGMSGTGRARFGRFPPVLADDLLVQRLFGQEQSVISDATFDVRAPRDLVSLLAVRTRVARGNRELVVGAASDLTTEQSSSTTSGTARALLGLLRRSPSTAPAVAVYVAVTIASRVRARGSHTAWLRDDSSRSPVAGQRRGADVNATDTATSGRPVGATRVAYLVSQYPATSHVFIEREVLGLRAVGAEIDTFSVRPAPSTELRGEAMRAEADRTQVILSSKRDVVRAQTRLLRTEAAAYLSVLARAARTGDRTARARTWQGFYHLEAATLYLELKRRGLRHVHVHFANNGADIARLVVALGRAIDGPDAGWCWSFTMHGPTEFEAVERMDLAAKVRDAGAVACISDFTRSQLMRLVEPEHWPKLIVVRMSVDTNRFAPPAVRRERQGPFKVLSVGRLVPEKGAPILIEAVIRMLAAGVEVHVRLAGGGPLAKPLGRAIEQAGLAEHFTLLGPVGQDDIVDLYHWADAFCLPSFQEGLPVVLMEAMATGLPVVTTQIAGIAELVLNESNGLVLPAGRSDLIADALTRLAAGDLDVDALGRAAREEVVAHYSTTTTSLDQLRFLRGVSGSGTSTR